MWKLFQETFKMEAIFESQIVRYVTNNLKGELPVESSFDPIDLEAVASNYLPRDEIEDAIEFKCRKCPNAFGIPPNLQRHVKPKQPKVTCLVCSKEVPKANLKRHLKRH